MVRFIVKSSITIQVFMFCVLCFARRQLIKTSSPLVSLASSIGSLFAKSYKDCNSFILFNHMSPFGVQQFLSITFLLIYRPYGINTSSVNTICNLQSSICNHSAFIAFTGFINAAFIAWKLIVITAINIAAMPATAKTHHCIFTWYA